MRTAAYLSVLVLLATMALGAASGGGSAAEDPSAADLLAEAERLDLEGKWHEARSLYDRAVEAAERTLAPDDPLLAEVLIAAADLFARLDIKTSTHYPLLRRARSILGGDLPPCAAALTSIPAAHRLARVRECLAAAEAETGPESIETARALALWGVVAVYYADPRVIDPSEYDVLHGLAERSIRISTRLFGADHPYTAWGEVFLGTVLGATGRCAEARVHLDRAIGAFERTLGPDRAPANVPLFALLAHCDVSPEESATLMARAGLAGLRRCEVGGTGMFNPVRENLNSFTIPLTSRFNRGDVDGAEAVIRLYPEAVAREAERIGADDGCRALSRYLEHQWAYRMGDHAAGAVRVLRDMEERLAAAYGPDSPLIGSVMHDLTWMYLELGERDQAIAAGRRGVAITDRSGVDPFLRGLNLNALAYALYPEDDVERRDLLQRAIEAYSLRYLPDSTHILIIRTGLGVVAEERGDLEAARAAFEQYVRAGTSQFMDEHSDRLGSVYFRLGRLEEAEDWLEKAAALYGENLGPRHPTRLRVEATLAAVRAARGRRASAFSTALGTAPYMRDHLRTAARGSPERVVLNLVGKDRWGLEVALSVAGPGLDAGSRTRLFDEVIRSRAVVLDETAGRRRLAAMAGDPATSALAAELAKHAMRLANLTVGGSADEKVLAIFRERKERAEEALALKSATFARNLASAKVGLEDVRRALPENTALVSYVRYDADAAKARPYGVPPDPSGPGGAYMAFVLRPGSEPPALVPIGPGSEVDAAVRGWRAAMTNVVSQGPVIDTGTRLRRLIWDPVAKHLGDATRVLVVPDGAVSFVSFPALPSPDGSYLVETGPGFHIVSAERDLAVPRTIPRRAEEMLVVGDPAYDEATGLAALRPDTLQGSPVRAASLEMPLGLEEEVAHGGIALRGRRSSCGGFSSMRFERLPATAKEADAVAGLWGGRAQQVKGSAAGESVIKSEVTHHRLIHIATHGFFLGGECVGGAGESRGIGGVSTMGPSKPAAAPPRSQGPRENPFLFSGLALAGANHRGAAGPEEDDGILTAEEIAALDLSGIDWAVLSACDTGVGDIRASEGVFGLRRAFQVAGAGTLIMSLWPVDDESAQEWMTALYGGRIEKNLGTAEAVREASLAVLRHRRASGKSTHPFYWAAFMAAGDWR